MNASTTDLDAGTDLEEFEPDLAEGGLARSVPRNTSARSTESMRWAKAENQSPELVGGHPARAGAISKEVLLRLQMRFSISPRAQ